MNKPFRETVELRMKRDPEFRKALEEENLPRVPFRLWMKASLADYIAEYVNKKYQESYHNHRTGPFPSITKEMVLKAISAYEVERNE